MKLNKLFLFAFVGILAGLISVYIYNVSPQSQPPIAVNFNPYKTGIYATGIVESYQPNGTNINIYPEVSGRVTHIFVNDGQTLKEDAPLLAIDDSIQREIVAKDTAQVKFAEASLINVQEQLQKIRRSYELEHKSISKNVLDNAINAVIVAKDSVDVAKTQYNADKALLDKYTIKSPVAGMVLRVVTATGSYISPLGAFDSYTQSMLPVIQMGIITPYMEVRCFLDEILVPRLPEATHFSATMFIRGENNKAIPLEFVRIQPYTIPNIQISDQRLERVDVRVLPIIFRFKKPMDVNIYPGQLVDIYIKGKQ